jgi:hypothetical protein
VTGSDYANVTLDSTESVNVTIDSVPGVVTIAISSDSGAGSTELTIGGLAASSTFYLQQDGEPEGFELTTDGNGSYT